MNITPYAMEITKDNYPFALACLPAGFAVHSLDSVLGAYLIINQIERVKTKHYGWKPVLMNCWLDAEAFEKTYRPIEKDPYIHYGPFFPVEKI